MGKILRDNIVAIMLAVIGWVGAITYVGWQHYQELNEARIRHDERIKTLNVNTLKFEAKQEQMLKDIREIKDAVIKISSIAETKNFNQLERLER